MDFVESGAWLLADVYGITKNKDRVEFAEILKSVNVPVFVPKSGMELNG